MIICEVCGETLAKPARGRVPRFCGTRCRVAAHRKQTTFYVPAEMQDADRWILHKDKRPLGLDGYWISIHDSSEWATHKDAKASDRGDGIGFVLNGDGIVCIDLDHCMANGKPNQKAQALIESLPRTFIEVSPSGRGLHIWGYGSIDTGKKFERDGLSVEVYGNQRFLTVTGNPLVKAKLARIDIAQLVG